MEISLQEPQGWWWWFWLPDQEFVSPSRGTEADSWQEGSQDEALHDWLIGCKLILWLPGPGDGVQAWLCAWERGILWHSKERQRALDGTGAPGLQLPQAVSPWPSLLRRASKMRPLATHLVPYNPAAVSPPPPPPFSHQAGPPPQATSAVPPPSFVPGALRGSRSRRLSPQGRATWAIPRRLGGEARLPG